MKVAVAGSTGLIGREVVSSATAAGHQPVGLARFALEASCPSEVHAIPSFIHRWLSENQRVVETVCAALGDVDVLVNAAGLADPAGGDRNRLFNANALLPGILAAAAARTGIRRMIHVSSSAVQQRLGYLDESPATRFMTPYGASKAAAEWLLSQADLPRPDEIVIYRPTSAQSASRPITRRLVALASHRVLPVPGSGRAKLPLCLLDNLAAGIVHVIGMPSCPPIVLQPWEGLTTRLMFQVLGNDPLLVPVPRIAGRAVLFPAYLVGRFQPRVAALAHTIELLALGREQRAEALAASGFQAPAGVERYRQIAEEIRHSNHSPAVR